jgi:hypothetical protein
MLITASEHRMLIGPLHLEQPGFGRGIACKTIIPIEMVGLMLSSAATSQSSQALRQVDLVARQFQHIDAAFRQWFLPRIGKPILPPRRTGMPLPLRRCVDQRLSWSTCRWCR